MFGPKWSFLLILIVYGPGVVFVKYWDRLSCVWGRLYLGKAPRTKETMPDFHEMVSGYPTSTNIPRVDGLSMDPREMGHHNLELLRGTEVPVYIFIFIFL